MARISAPDHGLGEHVDWALYRPKMAVGMGAFSEAIYGNTQLPTREREAARYTIALLNDCQVCQGSRAKLADEAGIDEGFYRAITNWRDGTGLTDRERMAAEFAHRFAFDHMSMDQEFWDRAKGHFSDDELADLTMCCGMFLGLGRMLGVLGVPAPEERLLV